MIRKYSGSSAPDAIKFFIDNGFLIIEDVYDGSIIQTLSQKVKQTYYRLRPKDFNLPGVSALKTSRDILEQADLGKEILDLVKHEHLLDQLQPLLGPDISIFNHTNLWINDPDDQSSVTNKALHQEVWTGSTVDDVTVWAPLSGVDNQNTLSVIPGSHLYGFIPNRNRRILPQEGVNLGTEIPLSNVKSGDIVIFHSLLVHGTAGRSEQIRFSLSSTYKNTFVKNSEKHQALGYTGLRFGPLTEIKSALGNDFLSPFRTYGGAISNHPAFQTNTLATEHST